MKVFVISLKDSCERRQSISTTFAKEGIKFEFFDAVVGNEINRNDNSQIWDKDEFVIQNNLLSKTKIIGKLNSGELGCALSHLKLYEKIISEKLKGALICEDDLIPECNIVVLIKEILKIKPDAQLIHPCTIPKVGLRQGIFNKKYSINLNNKTYVCYRAGIPCFDWFLNRRRRISNTTCYYISNSGAERLLDIGFPVRMEADRLTGMVAFNKLKIYLVDPPAGHWLRVPSLIGSDRHQHAI